MAVKAEPKETFRVTCVEKVKKAGDQCCPEHESSGCSYPSGSYDEDGNEVCDHCNLMVYENTKDGNRKTVPWRQREVEYAAFVAHMTKFQDGFKKGRGLAFTPYADRLYRVKNGTVKQAAV